MTPEGSAGSYLYGKPQMRYSVVFTVMFALLAFILLIPYSQNVWFALGPHKPTAYTLGFFLACVLVIVLDKHLLYRIAARRRLTTWHYVAWNVAEIVLLAGLYTLVSVKLHAAGRISLENPDAGAVFFQALFHAVFALGVPYLLAGFYFAVQDRDNTIRLMNYGNVVSDYDYVPQDMEKINLFDNDGVLKLSVSMKNIFYIESDDNYIKVWYSDSKGDLRQYMLRCRLKTVEESFAGSDLVRCHRKYIVNISRVQVLSKEKEGYQLDLGLAGAGPIPITKTYEEEVLNRFNTRR